MPYKSCENCANLAFYECPAPHFRCYKNPDCPCNGDEVPDKEYYCGLHEQARYRLFLAEE